MIRRLLDFLRCYTYLDAQLICENGFDPRLLSVEVGLAARPFDALEGLEIRIGANDIDDVRAGVNCGLTYVGFRVVF